MVKRAFLEQVLKTALHFMIRERSAAQGTLEASRG